MRVPATEQIIRVLAHKGMQVFTGDHYDLNIVGIRSDNIAANRFDDLLVVFYQRADAWCQLAFPFTTDPGSFWLNNPMNVKGTAVLKAGQYREAFQIGLHQGNYTALVQHAPLTVLRDNDRDAELDFRDAVEETGMFGINIHRARATGESAQVDKWSAGCQVLANADDFDVFMALCRAAARRWGGKFTYTLLNERDFGLLV